MYKGFQIDKLLSNIKPTGMTNQALTKEQKCRHPEPSLFEAVRISSFKDYGTGKNEILTSPDKRYRVPQNDRLVG